MGYIVASQMRLDIGRTRHTSCTVKDVSMLGIMCEFMANFVIPDYMGLRKSVSRGFGAVVGINGAGPTTFHRDLQIFGIGTNLFMAIGAAIN